MSKKEKKAVPQKTSTVAAPKGFKKIAGGEMEGEFFDAVEGSVILGTIEGGFSLEGDYGKRVVFRIRDDKGQLWLLSEKAGFRDALLGQKVGSGVQVSFFEKVKMKGAKGQFWETETLSNDAGTGPTVAEVVAKEDAERERKAAAKEAQNAEREAARAAKKGKKAAKGKQSDGFKADATEEKKDIPF